MRLLEQAIKFGNLISFQTTCSLIIVSIEIVISLLDDKISFEHMRGCKSTRQPLN